MITRVILVITLLVALAAATGHKDFPQWDSIHWLVRSTDQITLKCDHPKYYPFNQLSVSQNVQWILPKSTSYRHMKPGESKEGWTMKNSAENYALTIDKSNMNVPEAADGMYLCAVLAPTKNDPSIYSWYYLRWGVGLYSNVPAMNTGSTADR